MDRVINAVAFQAGWWACVASVRHGLDLQAVAACAVLAGWQVARSPQPAAQARLLAIVGVLGIAVDSLLQHFGVIRFQGAAFGPLSPVWLWMLWVLFATTLTSSLDFLQARPLAVSAVLGLAFGPASYAGGAQFGAAAFEASAANVMALGIVWMLVLPLTVAAARALAPRRMPDEAARQG